MSYFMRGDEADEVSHQGVVELHLPGARIGIGCLDKVPVVYELHYIMVPADVTFENFSAAGVGYIRSVGIFYIRGEIADHGETGVFQAHRFVILRPFLADDGILK